MKKSVADIALIISIVFALTVAGWFVTDEYIRPYKDYKAAAELKNQHDYHSAYYGFLHLGDYRDAQEQAAECLERYNAEIYSKACDYELKHDYLSAIACFESIADYKDSAERIELIILREADSRLETAKSELMVLEFDRARAIVENVSPDIDFREFCCTTVEEWLENSNIPDEVTQMRRFRIFEYFGDTENMEKANAAYIEALRSGGVSVSCDGEEYDYTVESLAYETDGVELHFILKLNLNCEAEISIFDASDVPAFAVDAHAEAGEHTLVMTVPLESILSADGITVCVRNDEFSINAQYYAEMSDLYRLRNMRDLYDNYIVF